MAYNASKAAVKTLAEHLSYDLRSTSTSIHLLVPGWTHTGLTGATNVREKPPGAWAPQQVADFLEERMDEGQFYVLCPDNDVTEDKDRRRMLWAMGDAVEGRPPLSRWREDWKDKAQDGIENMKLP
jgi:short-subunit dehydrogenase